MVPIGESTAVLSSPRLPCLLVLGCKALLLSPSQHKANTIPSQHDSVQWGLHCRKLFMQQFWVLLILIVYILEESLTLSCLKLRSSRASLARSPRGPGMASQSLDSTL